MDEVRELTNERIRDSDGECYISIIEREEKLMILNANAMLCLALLIVIFIYLYIM